MHPRQRSFLHRANSSRAGYTRRGGVDLAGFAHTGGAQGIDGAVVRSMPARQPLSIAFSYAFLIGDLLGDATERCGSTRSRDSRLRRAPPRCVKAPCRAGFRCCRSASWHPPISIPPSRSGAGWSCGCWYRSVRWRWRPAARPRRSAPGGNDPIAWVGRLTRPRIVPSVAAVSLMASISFADKTAVWFERA